VHELGCTARLESPVEELDPVSWQNPNPDGANLGIFFRKTETHMKRIDGLKAVLALSMACWSLPQAMAQTAAGAAPAPYPVSRVTLVTHSSPGGGTDVFLRDLGKYLPTVMKAGFAVENIRGGSGAKAIANVAKAAPDGSMFYGTTPTYIQTTLLSKPTVGYDGLDPMLIVFIDPEVIFTRAESPFKSLQDVMTHAKNNPGKSRWGSSNPASLERIGMEKLARAGGVKVPIVSHEGGADQMIGVLNGTYDIGIGEIQELQGQLEAGKIRLLATLSEKRLAGLPQLQTAKEQGFDVVIRKFRGIAAPKGLPDSVAKTWEDAVRKVLEIPAYKAEYTKDSLTPMLLGREAARKFTAEVAAETAASFKEMGLTK
jgi:tripartite-type tricarboxylate transporter receptor subunit TctC